MQIPLPTGFDKLNRSEQINYIGDLWDWFISQPDDTIAPQWHMDIVLERLADHDPERSQPWTTVKQRNRGIKN
ncbi:MAG: addiction module protein [Moorea sp. SIO2I5]|nr:addiction module protein [Moorena sp. SIO2I5]